MSDCILWDGATNQKGYGVTRDRDLAHRAAYLLNIGEIPAGYDVHHKCGVPGCVNPDHLEAVSRLEHNRRHVEGGALGDRIEAVLNAWGPMRGKWLARGLHADTQHVLVTLKRAAKAGRVEKLTRGTYAPLKAPQCPGCGATWWERNQWCRVCHEPKWVLLRDLIEANR